MLKVIKNISGFASIRKSSKYTNSSVGFIPTMGALHEGHLSLIKKSKKENDITIVSIFVNPTQFNDKADFENYPATVDNDIKKLEKENVDYLLLPSYKELYPDNYKYVITENSFSKQLCGNSREGHFDGVLTVVMKLLNIVNANVAYFGEKDYQQYKLIKGMAEAFFIDTRIISVETVREADGLAFSSRNARLSKEDRERALLFPKLLKSDASCDEVTKELTENNFLVDYITEIDGRRFGAVNIGSVRLIDNVET